MVGQLAQGSSGWPKSASVVTFKYAANLDTVESGGALRRNMPQYTVYGTRGEVEFQAFVVAEDEESAMETFLEQVEEPDEFEMEGARQ